MGIPAGPPAQREGGCTERARRLIDGDGLGVFAGAIGSSFDSGVDLRRLTHGQRKRRREYTESA